MSGFITLDSIIICVSVAIAFILFFSVIYHSGISKIGFKIALNIIFVILCIFTGLHAFKKSKINAHISEFEEAFNNKEILICRLKDVEYQVDKNGFIYLPDTLLFMGKNDNRGVNINISDCISHLVEIED